MTGRKVLLDTDRKKVFTKAGKFQKHPRPKFSSFMNEMLFCLPVLSSLSHQCLFPLERKDIACCTGGPLLNHPQVPVLFIDWLIAEYATGCSLHMEVSCNLLHFYRGDDACLAVSFPYLDSHVHLHRGIFLKLSLGETSPQHPVINTAAWGKYIHLHI